MRVIGREGSLALVFAVLAATSLAAQTTSSKTCKDGKQAIGFLGISGIDCNCTIGSPNSDQWSFRTEPKITSLEVNTRGGNVLKTGDVITHVNGLLITTRQGARGLATVKPGEVVVLTIRRDGETLKFAITADATCPDDVRLGIYAPGRPGGYVPKTSPATPKLSPATPQPGVPVAAPKPGAIGRAPTPKPPMGTPGVVAGARAVYAVGARPRGSFGFGLMCSGNCEIRAESDGALYFSEPPEVYSVERGSGADKAGIRRGDLITHVNDQSITSKEGGRIFGLAKSGQSVRFTLRRGGSSRTFSLTAASPTATAVDMTKSTEALGRAQESLRELQREQQIQMEKIQEEIRASRAAEQDRVRETQRELYRQEQEHRRKLTELSNELARAESRIRAATDSMRSSSCSVTTTAPRGGSRTLRYTGLVADAEIEVRGPNPVTVTEDNDEVTITAGQTQVKIKKHR